MLWTLKLSTHFRLLFICLMFLCTASCVTTQRANKQVSSLDILEPEISAAYVDSVVLLHGLARHSDSMDKIARELAKVGYRVCNIDYPSRYFEVEILAQNYVLPKIKQCQEKTTGRLHFVTHSMGALIVRSLEEALHDFSLGQMVMLSPPNQGSELVDKFGESWLSYILNGPAGKQLGTEADDLPQNLAIPRMPFGVLAAKSSNSLMSLLIKGDDDGKVSLERMRLQGMRDFLVVSSTHSFMMRDREVIEQTLHFLQYKEFYRSAPRSLSDSSED